MIDFSPPCQRKVDLKCSYLACKINGDRVRVSKIFLSEEMTSSYLSTALYTNLVRHSNQASWSTRNMAGLPICNKQNCRLKRNRKRQCWVKLSIPISSLSDEPLVAQCGLSQTCSDDLVEICLEDSHYKEQLYYFQDSLKYFAGPSNTAIIFGIFLVFTFFSWQVSLWMYTSPR